MHPIPEISLRHLRSVPAFPADLQILTISDSPVLSLPLPTGLRQLTISGCPGLLASLRLPATLEQLSVQRDPQLEEVSGLPARLKDLRLDACASLASVDGQNLTSLAISDCDQLVEVATGVLTLCNCSLTRAPALSASQLSLFSCRGLDALACLSGLAELTGAGPPPLTELTIHDAQLTRLALPPTVRVLELKDCFRLAEVSGPASDTPLELRLLGGCSALVRCSTPRLERITVVGPNQLDESKLTTLLDGRANTGARSEHSEQGGIADTVQPTSVLLAFVSAGTRLPSLPPTVKRLMLDRCPSISERLRLPAELEELYFRHSCRGTFALPAGLQVLDLDHSSPQFDRLPAGLRVLVAKQSFRRKPLELGSHPELERLEVDGWVFSRGIKIESLEQYQALWRPRKGAR